MKFRGFYFLILLIIFLPQAGNTGQSTESTWMWLSDEEKSKVFIFAEEYMQFISKARTELSTVREVLRLAEQEGFRQWEYGGNWQPGMKFYAVNRGRMLCLVVVGTAPLHEGIHIVGSHIDSPRLELKANPLYEREGMALFQTNYHGGIKQYQWVNIPLALEGRIDLISGEMVWLSLGINRNDPIFIIPDLAPHVDREYRSRSAGEALKYEELDPISGSIPIENASVKHAVLSYLKETYNITSDDFVSAELSVVPAMEPRDLGFDRGLIAAYGQDDNLCTYAAVRASFSVNHPRYTTVTYLTDNEESGSNNNTGAQSDFLRALIGEMAEAEHRQGFSENKVRLILRVAEIISADVTTGINPQFPGVQEKENAGKLGYGVVIKRFGRGNDPNSEFTAKIRRIFERGNIPWHTHTYKVGVGGGGTIGAYLSRENMDVIDIGVPVLSMHSPYEIASKVDIYNLYRAFEAFYSYEE